MMSYHPAYLAHSFIMTASRATKGSCLTIDSASFHRMKLITGRLIILFLVNTVFTFANGAPSGQYLETGQIKDNNLIVKVLGTLKRLVDFFARDYDSINLDGIYGLRVAEGKYTCIIQLKGA